MKFNNYQELALRTWKPEEYPIDVRAYLVMGLTGEAGEVAEKIKKLFRNGGAIDPVLLKYELGDVLWYLSTLAHELGFTLDDVAQSNLDKLWDRKERGVIKSEGDTR